MSVNGDGGNALQRALGPVEGCLPVERLGEAWTPEETRHVEGCPHCQSEVALYRAFATSATADEERAGVERITSALDARFSAALREPQTTRRWFSLPRLAAFAATVAVAALAVYALWDPEPTLGLRNPPSEAVYRTMHVQLIAPLGEVRSAPATLRWTAFENAAAYDVRVMEVDRAIVWQTSTASTAVTLPSHVVARFVPGKTLLWQVVARSAAGGVMADSGTQEFRVATSPLRTP